MTLDEVAVLVRRSRRTVMRLVAAKLLPRPVAFNPMSWDDRAVRLAAKKLKDGSRPNGRKR